MFIDSEPPSAPNSTGQQFVARKFITAKPMMLVVDLMEIEHVVVAGPSTINYEWSEFSDSTNGKGTGRSSTTGSGTGNGGSEGVNPEGNMDHTGESNPGNSSANSGDDPNDGNERGYNENIDVGDVIIEEDEEQDEAEDQGDVAGSGDPTDQTDETDQIERAQVASLIPIIANIFVPNTATQKKRYKGKLTPNLPVKKSKGRDNAPVTAAVMDSLPLQCISPGMILSSPSSPPPNEGVSTARSGPQVMYLDPSILRQCLESMPDQASDDEPTTTQPDELHFRVIPEREPTPQHSARSRIFRPNGQPMRHQRDPAVRPRPYPENWRPRDNNNNKTYMGIAGLSVRDNGEEEQGGSGMCPGSQASLAGNTEPPPAHEQPRIFIPPPQGFYDPAADSNSPGTSDDVIDLTMQSDSNPPTPLNCETDDVEEDDD